MSPLSELAHKVRAQLTAPGAPFETVVVDVDGRAMRVYRNAFPTLPALISSARAHGGKPFIRYLGETWTFDRFFCRGR